MYDQRPGAEPIVLINGPASSPRPVGWLGRDEFPPSIWFIPAWHAGRFVIWTYLPSGRVCTGTGTMWANYFAMHYAGTIPDLDPRLELLDAFPPA